MNSTRFARSGWVKGMLGGTRSAEFWLSGVLVGCGGPSESRSSSSRDEVTGSLDVGTEAEGQDPGSSAPDPDPSRSLGLTAWMRTTDGALELRSRLPVPGEVFSVVLLDMTFDGKVDAVVSSSEGILLYEGDQSGMFAASRLLRPANQAILEVVDLDRDGQVELLSAELPVPGAGAETDWGEFLLRVDAPTPEGTWSERRSWLIDSAAIPERVGVFDVDGDGEQEVFVASARRGCSSQVYWHLVWGMHGSTKDPEVVTVRPVTDLLQDLRAVELDGDPSAELLVLGHELNRLDWEPAAADFVVSSLGLMGQGAMALGLGGSSEPGYADVLVLRRAVAGRPVVPEASFVPVTLDRYAVGRTGIVPPEELGRGLVANQVVRLADRFEDLLLVRDEGRGAVSSEQTQPSGPPPTALQLLRRGVEVNLGSAELVDLAVADLDADGATDVVVLTRDGERSPLIDAPSFGATEDLAPRWRTVCNGIPRWPIHLGPMALHAEVDRGIDTGGDERGEPPSDGGTEGSSGAP